MATIRWTALRDAGHGCATSTSSSPTSHASGHRREKQEREAIAAEPVAPLPPEQDWRHAGEFIKYSHTATVPFWKVGYSSLFIYLGLLWVCSPLALIYIWMTEWRMFTKVYRTGVALLFVAALMNYIARRTGLG
ncbi:MAG: hypothetical protein E6J51_08395 [Chloroflexi bacterium]|nr:MAG: hypothetical protein E6J51_08395 [Chloroflexota bacterium]